MTVTILLLMGLIVGIANAEVTFTVDKPEFVRAGPGQTQDFTLTVCGVNQPYQVSIVPYTTNTEMTYKARGQWGTGQPALSSSSVNVTHYLDSADSFYVKDPSGSCDTMTFRTGEGTGINTYDYYLSVKTGQYFDLVGNRIRISVLDPEEIQKNQSAQESAAKVAALEAKVTEQEQQIAELRSNVSTPAPTEIPTPTATAEVTGTEQVQTIGQLAGVTDSPTHTPHVHQTVNETRIAELEAKVAEQQQQLDTQKGLLDQILAFLGLA